MKVFIDTNIILDVLLNRYPFADDSEKVLSLCETNVCNGCISVLTVCNLVYILRKFLGSERAETEVGRLLTFLELESVTVSGVKSVLQSEHPDFEDAIQLQSARESGADVVITRDKKGFDYSDILICTATQFLEEFSFND